MHDPDATPKASDTFLMWEAQAAQAREMCQAAAQGMRPQVFDRELWEVYQSLARVFEKLEKSFRMWPVKPGLEFGEKSADIRALETIKQAAQAMIEARRMR